MNFSAKNALLLCAVSAVIAQSAIVKKNTIIGKASSLPDGYFVWSTNAGIYKSALKSFAPQKIPDTEANAKNIEISHDGKWILYFCYEQGSAGDAQSMQGVHKNGSTIYMKTHMYLICPDGSNKTRVPVNKSAGSGFVRSGPKGAEIFYLSNGTCKYSGEYQFSSKTIHGLTIGLQGSTPSFGDTRKIADISTNSQPFRNHHEQGISVAADHIYAGIFSRPTSFVIPNSGTGVATMEHGKALWGGFNCGCDMSPSGKLCAQNINKWEGSLDLPNGHVGPVLYNFWSYADRTTFEQQLVSANWAPSQYRNKSTNDWHYWDFTNDNDYIIGVNQGSRSTTDIDYPPPSAGASGLGIWLLHWPTGTWTQLSAGYKARSKSVTAFFAAKATSIQNSTPLRIAQNRPAEFRKAFAFPLVYVLLPQNKQNSAFLLTGRRVNAGMSQFTKQMLRSAAQQSYHR